MTKIRAIAYCATRACLRAENHLGYCTGREPSDVAVELRRMAKRIRAVAAPLIDEVADNTSPGLLRAADMLGRRALRLDRAKQRT